MSQEPSKECNAVTSNRRGTKRGRGRKPSHDLAFMIICLFGLMGFSSAINPESTNLTWKTNGAVYANRPLVCGSYEPTKPMIYPITTNYTCDKGPTAPTLVPTPVSVSIYHQNVVEWKSRAYQCQKWRQTTSTQISFFTDVKTTKMSTVPLTVSVEECHDTVRTQTCSEGTLTGHDGCLRR